MTAVKIMTLLTLPLVISGILHMIVVKADLFSSLKIPLNTRAFGQNKTWRGFVIIPLTTIAGIALTVFLQEPLGVIIFKGWKECLAVGASLGLAYALGELPNSYWKRQKGIQEGSTPTGKKWLHVLVDQGDSVLACALVYAIYYEEVRAVLATLTVLAGIAVHLLINFSLYLCRLRNGPF